MNSLKQHYNEVKAEYESVQKTLTELEAKQAKLKNNLVSLNFRIQVEDKGITRPTPVGFMTGNGS